MHPLPLLLAADLNRAEEWLKVIRRSHRVELLASLDLPASGVEGLDAALDANRDASAIVWAAGEWEANRVVDRLAAHPGVCLLHPPPTRAPNRGRVQLAHGWLSLNGIGALARLFASRRVERVELTARGTPEGPATGIRAALYHAMTLVTRLGHDVAIERAVLASAERLAVTAGVDGAAWRVEVGGRGHGLELVAHSAEGDYAWSADAVSETLQRPRAEARVIPASPWAERCLRQLQQPLLGASLADARRVRALVDQVEQALGQPLPPDRFSIGELGSSLAPLGLSADVPPAVCLVPTPPPELQLPLEALAYALDLKPSVHVTVQRQKAAWVTEKLPGFADARERRPEPSSEDRRVDALQRGVPLVDIYAARDEGTLRQLVETHRSSPAPSVTRLGALLGYPACCVQAFATLGEPADESYNRVAAARRTSVGGTWPAELDDTSLPLLPHFLCTYRCERSLQQARRFLRALRDEHSDVRRDIDAYLGGPVLYFDHRHQIRLRGLVRGPGVHYEAVSMPWCESRAFGDLGGAVAQGDYLVLDDEKLTVYRAEGRLFELRRTDPHHGVLMPFSRSL